MKRTTLAFLLGTAALLALSAAVSTSTQQAKAQQGVKRAHLPQPGLVAR